MFNNNNYNSRGVPEWMAYGGVPFGLPKGAVPQNATGGAGPQWALGKQNPTSPLGQPTQLAQNDTQMSDGNYSTTNYRLGTLSGLQESNNGQQLWNNGDLDKTGGWSYGTYQIETKRGTMNDYLNYLNQNSSYQPFYNSLQQAGGYNAALNGNDNFKNAWQELSQNPDFLES